MQCWVPERGNGCPGQLQKYYKGGRHSLIRSNYYVGKSEHQNQKRTHELS
jgi:hypothetical protein